MRVWLREIRKYKSLTQMDVAKRSGISRSYYTQIELMEHRKSPSVRAAKDIAKTLGFSWHAFFDGEEAVAEARRNTHTAAGS